MHFRTSDLLFVTAIAAMYATGYAYAPIESFKPIDLVWVLPPLSQAPVILKSRRGRRKIGRVVCRWRNPSIRWVHLAFACLFLGACVATSGTVVHLTVAVGAMTLTHHVMFACFSSQSIGSAGLLAGGVLLSRDDYRFEVDEEKKRLIYQRRPGKAAGFGHPYSGRVALPAEHVEAVSAWAGEEDQGSHG